MPRCSRCDKVFKTVRAFLAHADGCRHDGWDEHLSAVERGRPRKAARLARKLLGVERTSAPLPEELRAKWADPDVRKIAAQKARIRRAGIRDMKRTLAKAAGRKRRILA
jgi:uncharacterized C2H2 Zn-finger protein